MLKLEGVSKYYYSGNNIVLALRKLDIEFRLGEFVAITGESGSGKSTLLNVLSGLDTFEDGKMFINHKDISHYSVDELEHYRKDYIAFVFQDYNIIDSYTVYQNIEMALTVQGYTNEEKKKRVNELIEKVGLSKQKHQKASKLSGGEKQRTVIARALAKDSPIIVCDEPTGNLDVESGKNVLKLLHEISKDKLVLIVTHDFMEVKEFVTRKIRLYDGELVEDNVYKTVNEEESLLAKKEYFTKTLDILLIGLRNVLSVPKKSFFIMIIMMFMITAFIFAYGSSLKERNIPYTDSTHYFPNAFDGRLVVTKRDNTSFTDDELSTISKLNLVRTVTKDDIVYDSILVNRIYNDEYEEDEFFLYKTLNVLELDEFDLLSGKLPTRPNEVVIGNSGMYEIGDVIQMSNRSMIALFQGARTDMYEFKVVGIVSENVKLEDRLHDVYLTPETLSEISRVSYYENAQIFLEVTGVTKYDIINEIWVTVDIDENVENGTREYSIVNNIWIDDTLEDNQILTYDMMFFDICRDFGYKEEMADDFDAGLCHPTDFIDTHLLTVGVVTAFDNKKVFTEVEFLSDPQVGNLYGQGLYMNETTFDAFFKDDAYQVTAVVYDMYDANVVREELEALGYNVHYPAGVITEDDAINIIYNNIKLSLILGVTVVSVYFVGYFVLRNVISSKSKDYLIYRSIGTSKKSINRILVTEIFYLTMISFTIVITLFFINEQYNTSIPRLLRYFTVGNYITVFVSVLFIMMFMAYNFNRRIFGKSVISSLKGVQ